MNKGILLEAEYGLTNRLRALASAMNIASESHRFLLVVWPLDVHMGVPYHELFSVRCAPSRTTIAPAQPHPLTHCPLCPCSHQPTAPCTLLAISTATA